MRTEGRRPTEAERELGCTCQQVMAAPEYVVREFARMFGTRYGDLPVLHMGGCPFPGRPSADDVTQAVTPIDRPCACGCGQPVTSPRPEARYATPACRVRAHRAR